jgi:hypothetical protein
MVIGTAPAPPTHEPNVIAWRLSRTQTDAGLEPLVTFIDQ